MQSSRIAIAAGGTAGHVVPALAVADELRGRGVEVVFIGGARAEAELVPAAGYPFRELAVEGLSRSNPLKALRALARAALALHTARRMLAEIAPSAVLGGGGYVSGPVGLAALLGRIPLVLSEADSHVGLANRLLARGARRICLAFPPEEDAKAPARYLVTGRPVPTPKAHRAAERERAGISPDVRVIAVFGGSLGARSVNLAAIEGLAGLRVRHVAGRRDYAELARRELPVGYELIELLDVERFDALLATADLVVARAGGSVFEIAAHGLPAVLVPYPHATGEHQRGNARWMADAGAAVVIDDAELSPRRLRATVDRLLDEKGGLERMATASRGLARPQAAAEIADELLAAAGAR